MNIGLYRYRHPEEFAARPVLVCKVGDTYAHALALSDAGLDVLKLPLSTPLLPLVYPVKRAVRRFRAHAQAPGRVGLTKAQKQLLKKCLTSAASAA